MPRQPRLHVPGGLYHVIVRGLERRPIFLDDVDRKEFIFRLELALLKSKCRCYAWALMNNHFHLLLRPGKDPLSDPMRRLLSGYAIYFNKRYKRSGYLFQNRYKSILCQEDLYFLQLVRYIHLNPIRGGAVKDLRSLRHYPWAGHSVILGKRKAPWQETGEVLSRFSKNGTSAIRGYLKYLGDPDALQDKPEFLGGGLKRSAGGWAGVFALRSESTPWVFDNRVLGDGAFVGDALKESEVEQAERVRYQREGWTLSRLMDQISKSLGIEPQSLKRRGRENAVARGRDLVAYIGRKKFGLSAKEIQRTLSFSQPALSKAIRRGEKEFNENPIKL